MSLLTFLFFYTNMLCTATNNKRCIMNKEKVLYQIKTLDKLILRNYICDNKDKNSDYFVTPTQIQVIEYMIEHDDEEVYQKDLEKALDLRRATLSGVLQTMEKNNLLERDLNSNDARVKKIILKYKARNIFLKHKNKIEELEQIVTEGISNEELNIFKNVIEKMKNNLEIYDNNKEVKN